LELIVGAVAAFDVRVSSSFVLDRRARFRYHFGIVKNCASGRGLRASLVLTG
jgi:hypothetical protein